VHSLDNVTVKSDDTVSLTQKPLGLEEETEWNSFTNK